MKALKVSMAHWYSVLCMIAYSPRTIIIITGLKFWKSPRRKVFSVPKSDRKARKRKRPSELDSDSDEPMSPPNRARDDTNFKITRIESKVNYVREDLDTVKEAIKDMHLNEKSTIPMGLQ